MICSGNSRSGDIGGYDRGTELTMVSVDIDVQKIYMGDGNVPGKVDGRATVET